MTVKHILLPLTGETKDPHVALAALRLAKQLEAHVSAGYEDALGPLYMPTAGFIQSAPVYGDFFDQMQKLRAERLAAARGLFDKAVADTRLPIVSTPTCRQASAMWIQDRGSASLSERGVITDLVVAEVPGDMVSVASWSLVDLFLFSARTPLLLIPRKVDTAQFRRPLIAWNGSREALCALQRALQLFPADAEVTVLQVGKLSSGRIPAEKAAEYLGWHCVGAEVRHIDGKDSDAPAVLVEQAGKSGASAIVMGAYTHGRTRELFLGGLTDFMLRNATLPIFMSH